MECSKKFDPCQKTHEDDGLEFQDKDLVVFSEVHGMTELNDGNPRKVKNAGPYSFELDVDTTNYGG
ncbi:hypothetical protein MKW98_011327, partial [Papaver atlanticum]